MKRKVKFPGCGCIAFGGYMPICVQKHNKWRQPPSFILGSFCILYINILWPFCVRIWLHRLSLLEKCFPPLTPSAFSLSHFLYEKCRSNTASSLILKYILNIIEVIINKCSFVSANTNNILMSSRDHVTFVSISFFLFGIVNISKLV